MTIKFSIEFDAINSKNTFTNGDTINGRIIVDTSKQIEIRSLLFIAQGEARVSLVQPTGQGEYDVYRSEEKYYDDKHHIVREARQDGPEVLGKGRHVYPFSFKIPDRKMPSTFKSSTGKVVHKLKAELKQSMRLKKKAKIHYTFVSKADMDIPGLMKPQGACKDKYGLVFGSGYVSMDVHTERRGYKQGEGLQVTAEINNRLSRAAKLKFVLSQKMIYYSQGQSTFSKKKILKEKTEAFAPLSKVTVTKVLSIPTELPLYILNCSIIKLEYTLKIYLDIKFASNPKIKLPIIILTASELPAEPSALDGFGFEAFGSPNHSILQGTPISSTLISF